MALFHLNVKQIKRSQGQSAIASAAYRAGEKLSSEYYGEIADYTHKGGVICSEILLPDHVPREYADRETLWNVVEKVERGKNAQLAYSFDVALDCIKMVVTMNPCKCGWHGRPSGHCIDLICSLEHTRLIYSRVLWTFKPLSRCMSRPYVVYIG